MRVAVALPSLPPTSPQLAAILATIAALADSGVEIEAFAEEPRAYEHLEFDVYHYLRMPERNRDRQFDVGLYPLGRDWRPYEPAFLMLSRFPGVIWALDPVLHHLAIGGIAMTGWWDGYREVMERAHGPDEGARVAMTAAWGWASRAAFRRYDPVPNMLREQRAVCAATRSIAASFEAAGIEASLVPLSPAKAQDPASGGASTAGSESGRCRRILLLTFHYGWPKPVLSALRTLLEQEPRLDLRVVVPELVWATSIGPLAAELGIADRITWVLPEDDRLAEEVERADLVAYLRDDPTAGERALIDAALARGCPAMLLRAPLAHDLPELAAVAVEPGRALEASFAGLVRALVDDDGLYAGLSDAAREFATTRPGPAATAARLRGVLADSASEPLVERPVSAPAWDELRREMLTAVVPSAATAPLRDELAAILEEAVPEALRCRHVTTQQLG